MTKTFKSAALAATVAAAALLATPAAAQRNAAPAAPVVGYVDVEGAIAQSNAYRVAQTQVEQTYGPQLQSIEARATALQTEIQPLLAAAQAEAARTPRNEQAYNNAVRAFQTRQQAAQAEVDQLQAPIRLAQAYIQEQIAVRAREAITAARTARRVDVVLTAGAVLDAVPTANMTDTVVTELNRLVPNVQIVPPAGYEPGALQRAQLQAAAAAAQPGAAAPAPAQPETR